MYVYSKVMLIDVNGKTGQDGSSCNEVAMQSEADVWSFKFSMTLPSVNLKSNLI